MRTCSAALAPVGTDTDARMRSGAQALLQAQTQTRAPGHTLRAHPSMRTWHARALHRQGLDLSSTLPSVDLKR